MCSFIACILEILLCFLLRFLDPASIVVEVNHLIFNKSLMNEKGGCLVRSDHNLYQDVKIGPTKSRVALNYFMFSDPCLHVCSILLALHY
jgi:hypothetical protein